MVFTGVKTVNEVRVENGDDPYPGGVGDEPFILSGGQAIPLKEIGVQQQANGNGNGNGKKPNAQPDKPQPATKPAKPDGTGPKTQKVVKGIQRERDRTFRDASGNVLHEVGGWRVPRPCMPPAGR